MEYFFIDLAQYTLEGVLKGLLYAVVAIAFIVVYRSGRILNLAQGEILVLMAYVIWTFFSLMVFPFWIALLLSFCVAVFLGLIIERFIFRPLIGQPIWAIIMVSIGLMILIQGIVQVSWGSAERPFPQVFPEAPVRIGELIFTSSIFWGGIISLAIVAGLTVVFNRTRWGLKLTAVAEEHQVAQAIGISVKTSIAVAWIISCALSTFAAIVFLNGQTLTFAAAVIGLHALPVVLLAGLESISGAVVAGIIVGVGESWSGAYLDPYTDGAMSQAFPYVLMLVVLLIRPQGLFGWKIIERV
ncbi:MAG: branched-chain amino acid ABC transporter permease [Deltaproteobacteria bacterium]|jgi:branched-chain amino acid transport system permease protein|nr:branched-chain amino acid ABC transporter permease [Deltaproteobacteria bacterium]